MGLPNKHLKEVAAHAAICQSYQSKVESPSLDDTMMIGEQAHYGMASVLAYECSCCKNTGTATQLPYEGKWLLGVIIVLRDP